MKKIFCYFLIILIILINPTLSGCSKHTHKYVANIIKDSTCTETGIEEDICSCGHKITLTIPKKSHNYSSSYLSMEPTCVDIGIENYICSSCGYVLSKYIKAKGHKWDSGVVLEETSCAKEGSIKYTCLNCNEETIIPIEKTLHHYGDWVIQKEPTCDENGIKYCVCKDCQSKKTETIKALGHVWDDGVITKFATQKEEGIKTYTCAICNKTKTEKIDRLLDITVEILKTPYKINQYAGYGMSEVLLGSAIIQSMSYIINENSVTISYEIEKIYDINGADSTLYPDFDLCIYNTSNKLIKRVNGKVPIISGQKIKNKIVFDNLEYSENYIIKILVKNG